MSMTTDAKEVLDRDFLTIRSRLIDLAAALDRVERGEGSVEADPRMARIRKALAILAGPGADRTGRVQMAFSLPYHENWRQQFGLES
jgi:hypothetical protein